DAALAVDVGRLRPGAAADEHGGPGRRFAVVEEAVAELEGEGSLRAEAAAGEGDHHVAACGHVEDRLDVVTDGVGRIVGLAPADRDVEEAPGGVGGGEDRLPLRGAPGGDAEDADAARAAVVVAGRALVPGEVDEAVAVDAVGKEGPQRVADGEARAGDDGGLAFASARDEAEDGEPVGSVGAD